MDSWHEPDADQFTVGPDDYVWSEPGWSNSILFINADPSAPPPNVGGGGGNPPGGPGFENPNSINADKENEGNSKSCFNDDIKDLGRIGVTGSSGGLRRWLGGAASAWAIMERWRGGGTPARPGSSVNNPRQTPGESEDCPADAIAREQRAMEQIRAGIGTFGCIRNNHIGVYFEINFPNDRTGIYRGADSDCRGTHFAHEEVNPGC